MCVLLIYYSLILGPHYFFKEFGELCNANELITGLDECKSAVTELKYDEPNMKFDKSFSHSSAPKGCFQHKGTSKQDAYLNTHVSGNAHYGGTPKRPICRMCT